MTHDEAVRAVNEARRRRRGTRIERARRVSAYALRKAATPVVVIGRLGRAFVELAHEWITPGEDSDGSGRTNSSIRTRSND